MGKFDKNLVIEEIKKFSETPTNSIDTGGIMIATFTSVLEPNEIGDLFTSLELNNFVFDLDNKSSYVHMNNPMLKEGLFGLVNNVNNQDLDNMTSRLIRDISMSSTTKNNPTPPKAPKVAKKKNNQPSEEDIEKMSVKEKENLLNQYIDNGLENLTDSDKKIIELLAK
jgi:hypothetical protein